MFKVAELWDLWVYSFIKLKISLHLFLSGPTSLSSALGTSITHKVSYLKSAYTSIIFFPFKKVYVLFWEVSVTMSSSSPSCLLPSTPSSVFFFSHIVVFISSTSICFFFSFNIPCLNFLNTWNMVKITLLVSVNSTSPLDVFSFDWYFWLWFRSTCFLVCLLIFGRMSDILNSDAR